MELLAVIIAIASLFALIALGYAARKYGLLNGNRVHLISHVLVNIALPALTISSMQVPETAKTMGIVHSMLLVAVVYYLAALVAGIFICRFVPSTPEEKGVFQFMLVFPNTMFMGIPVALAVLGPSSLFYVILFNVPFYFLVFTLGVWLLARGRPGKIDPKVLLCRALWQPWRDWCSLWCRTPSLPRGICARLGRVGHHAACHAGGGGDACHPPLTATGRRLAGVPRDRAAAHRLPGRGVPRALSLCHG